MAGVRAATPGFWRGGSERPFLDHVRTVGSRLNDAAAALRDLAGHLGRNATATDEAQTGLRAASGMLGVDAGEEAAGTARRATATFHEAEQRTQRALWRLGAAAPGPIPLPLAMPDPARHGWSEAVDPEPDSPQFWIDHRGLPLLGVGGPYRAGLFGFDEDGNIVPAYQADPMELQTKEGEAPVLNLVELLLVGLRSRPRVWSG